jgi:hypothetical protein
MRQLTLEDGLRALEDAAVSARSIRIDLDEEYLRTIATTEALPDNQSGADKSWVWKIEHAFREHYKRARPV